MKYYTAIIEPGDEEHAYGVRFPDLPAVHSASDEGLEDAIKQAGIALRFYAEDISEMPESKAMNVQKDGDIIVAIPLLKYDENLIGAAPDMLEALKSIGCICQHGIDNPMVSAHSVKCKSVSDAIKKAGG